MAADVVSALRDAGIESILLKGASFDRWLYDPDAPRIYSDVDLLIDRRELHRVAAVLSEIGFAQPQAELRPTHTDHATVWRREPDRLEVDLHHRMVGVPAAVDAWQVLPSETETMQIGGRELRVLNPAARAVHIALHAAEHGVQGEKSLFDLERALQRLPEPTWRSAAAVAARLEATEAFAAGLRLLPEGGALALRLGLPEDRSVETVMWNQSVPYSSWFVNRLANTPGVAAKLRLLARRVAPEPEFMRAWYPVARRGPIGLALSYGWRLLWLAAHVAPAVAAWLRARREARRAG